MARPKRKRKPDGTGGSKKRNRKSDDSPMANNQNPVTPGTGSSRRLTRTELKQAERTRERRLDELRQAEHTGKVLFPGTPDPKQKEPSTPRGGVGTIQSTSKIKQKELDDKLFNLGLNQDLAAVKEALEKSDFNTDDNFAQALFVTYQSTMQMLSRLVYIVHTLIEQQLISEGKKLNSPPEDATKYQDIPADFSYYIRMFLVDDINFEDDPGEVFSLLSPGGNLKVSFAKRLTNYQMERKWATLTRDVLALGKSLEYKTILKYLKAYLGLVIWYTSHVKAPPRRSEREDDFCSFEYDNTDREVSKEQTTNYMLDLVVFFKSLIKTTPIRRLTKVGSDQERMSIVLQQARAKLVEDSLKSEIIVDESEAKHFFKSPDIPSRIKPGTDVLWLYDVEVMSLWRQMQVPNIQVFDKISLEHFSAEAMCHPPFVKRYLPSLAACSFLYMDGMIHIPFSKEVLYHLIIYKDEVLPFYDVSVHNCTEGFEIALTRKQHVTTVTDVVKHYRDNAEFVLTSFVDLTKSDISEEFIRTILMASCQLTLVDGLVFKKVETIVKKLLSCFGGESDKESFETFSHHFDKAMDVHTGTVDLEQLLKIADDTLVSQLQKTSVLTFDKVGNAGHFIPLQNEFKKVDNGSHGTIEDAVFNSTLFVTTPTCSEKYESNSNTIKFYESEKSRAHAKGYPMDRIPQVNNYIVKQKAGELFFENVEKSLFSGYSGNHFRYIAFLFETDTAANTSLKQARFFEKTLEILQKYYFLPVKGEIMVPLTNYILDLVMQHEAKLKDLCISAQFCRTPDIVPDLNDDDNSDVNEDDDSNKLERDKFERVIMANFSRMEIDDDLSNVKLSDVVDVGTNVTKADFTSHGWEEGDTIRWLKLTRLDPESRAGIVLPSNKFMIPQETVFDDYSDAHRIAVGKHLVFRRSNTNYVRLDTKQLLEEESENNSKETRPTHEKPQTILFEQLQYPLYDMGAKVYSPHADKIGVVKGYGNSLFGYPAYLISFNGVPDGQVKTIKYTDAFPVYEIGATVNFRENRDKNIAPNGKIISVDPDRNGKPSYSIRMITKQGDETAEEEAWYTASDLSDSCLLMERKENSLKFLDSMVFGGDDPESNSINNSESNGANDPESNSNNNLKKGLVEYRHSRPKDQWKLLPDSLLDEIVKDAKKMEYKADLSDVRGLGGKKYKQFADDIWGVITKHRNNNDGNNSSPGSTTGS